LKKIKKENQKTFIYKNNYFGIGFDENIHNQDEFEAVFENEFKTILKKFKKDDD